MKTGPRFTDEKIQLKNHGSATGSNSFLWNEALGIYVFNLMDIRMFLY